ncbi:hypothetical protein EVAR_83112_1 [Eumeta japonica]|uniref:Uncharacterized protein n=1 Tax=Eumeta variegata TaxID=151549 RepID=A0A4C1WLU6_EUMVA|nr:hypothetical protein EVAR_83112_1 [Eumeta japonica]
MMTSLRLRLPMCSGDYLPPAACMFVCPLEILFKKRYDNTKLYSHKLFRKGIRKSRKKLARGKVSTGRKCIPSEEEKANSANKS